MCISIGMRVYILHFGDHKTKLYRNNVMKTKTKIIFMQKSRNQIKNENKQNYKDMIIFKYKDKKRSQALTVYIYSKCLSNHYTRTL